MTDIKLTQCDVDSWILSNETLLKLVESQNVDLSVYDYPTRIATGKGANIVAGEILAEVKKKLGDATFQEVLRAATESNPGVLRLGAEAANRFIEENGLKRGDFTMHHTNPASEGKFIPRKDHDVVVVGGGPSLKNYIFDDAVTRMYPHVAVPLNIEPRAQWPAKAEEANFVSKPMLALLSRAVPNIKKKPVDPTEPQQG
uniref:Uncharacterized protein n=1 Tax=Pseudomonas phage RVTF4 TaxID=3236931 RepID=A0AB39CCS8_9VIRU